MRTALLTALLLPLLASPAPAEENGGELVNRFQLVARALKHPGLYRAALDYMAEVSFPKNDVLRCYWRSGCGDGSIRITNVLPHSTRTIVFHLEADGSWKVTEI